MIGVNTIPRTRVRVPVEMHVFHISSMIIIARFLLFTGVLGVTLNTMVIAATLKQNTKLTHFEVILMCLCLVDLLQSLFAYPLDAVSNMSHRWLYGYTGIYIKLYSYQVNKILLTYFSTPL